MSQRLITTEWLWYLLAFVGSWSPAQSIAVRTPPSNPATVEAQAKFFQDFFSVQLSPYKIEFGHVCEDPNTWEQRYEKKDYKNHRDMGKVRWGDKKGGYGEHYWDLNHAGHNNDHGENNYEGDDGSYHETNDPYDEPSENSPTYGNDEYDPETASYEETSRNKRAYPKVKVERKTVQSYENTQPTKRSREQSPAAIHNIETNHEDVINNNTPLVVQESLQEKRHQYQPQDDDDDVPKEKQQVVLVVNHKDTANQNNQYVQKRPECTHYVPYESGAGVRQHQANEETAAASVPRLFLEPSTGHVVDRATGQAYVLQPIAKYNNN